MIEPWMIGAAAKVGMTPQQLAERVAEADQNFLHAQQAEALDIAAIGSEERARLVQLDRRMSSELKNIKIE